MTVPAAPAHRIPLKWNAVVLAGGRATRLGGVAKPLVEVRGRTMLEAALAAAAGAERIVVVGPLPVPEGILRTVEDPPHGGPAAALAAGLATLDVDAPWTLVLASDLPGAEGAVPTLLSAAATESTAESAADGVCFHDALSMRRLLAPLDLRSLPGDPAAIGDCDTWADIDAANASAGDGVQEATRTMAHERGNR